MVLRPARLEVGHYDTLARQQSDECTGTITCSIVPVHLDLDLNLRLVPGIATMVK